MRYIPTFAFLTTFIYVFAVITRIFTEEMPLIKWFICLLLIAMIALAAANLAFAATKKIIANYRWLRQKIYKRKTA